MPKARPATYWQFSSLHAEHGNAMTRKRSSYRPRRLGLHPAMAAGAERIQRQIQAAEISRPMRILFALLATGEVTEVQGHAAMSMPEIDPSLRQSTTDWVEIAPAIYGWIDLWQRIAPDLTTTHLRYLADRLDTWKPLTPRLVEQARDEFEACITRIPDLPPGLIRQAILSTQIAWEFERQEQYP